MNIRQARRVCLECGAKTWFQTNELYHAAKPRCSACGSIALREPDGRAVSLGIEVAEGVVVKTVRGKRSGKRVTDFMAKAVGDTAAKAKRERIARRYDGKPAKTPEEVRVLWLKKRHKLYKLGKKHGVHLK